MFRRKVTAPNGKVWKIGRRWLPERPHFGRADTGDVSVPDFDGGGDDLGIVGTIVLVVFLFIAAIVLVLTLFNVFVIALELTILLVLFIAGLFGRIVLRRPWTISATTQGAYHYTADVVGWRASRREIDRVAARIESGELDGPPRDRRRLDD